MGAVHETQHRDTRCNVFSRFRVLDDFLSIAGKCTSVHEYVSVVPVITHEHLMIEAASQMICFALTIRCFLNKAFSF